MSTISQKWGHNCVANQSNYCDFVTFSLTDMATGDTERSHHASSRSSWRHIWPGCRWGMILYIQTKPWFLVYFARVQVVQDLIWFGLTIVFISPGSVQLPIPLRALNVTWEISRSWSENDFLCIWSNKLFGSVAFFKMQYGLDCIYIILHSVLLQRVK